MPSPSTPLFQLEHDAIIPLYALDLNPIGTNIVYRFCNWKDTGGLDVTFQGLTYTSMPIEAEGFEMDGSGDRSPRPTIAVSNADSGITALCLTYADLVGAKVTRKRTFASYLDTGVTPDPNLEFPSDVYYVGRKASENKLFVVFELRSPIDLGMSTMIPGRVAIKHYCLWEYRSAPCGYTGGAVATEKDIATGDINLDKCGKRVRSCELRFGSDGVLNFSSFPGLAN